MAKCCDQCFHDLILVAKIKREGEISRCGYCGTDRSSCIAPSALANELELLTFGLQEDIAGTPFSEILSLYGVLSEQVRNKAVLIDDIFGPGAANKCYSFGFTVTGYIQQWEDFKLELKHKNRFFPTSTIYSSLFSRAPEGYKGVLFQLLEQLKIPVDERESFFRARISDDHLEAQHMGCPPPSLVSGGRANPLGIPYLYVADKLITCISEVRPSNSSLVHVSEVTPLRELFVLDLTAPRKKSSAAAFGEEQLPAVLEFLSLLELFSMELSKPVRPENSNLDYIPTQFLCEFIKGVAKFDGLVFNSSFGDGKNYVFFDGLALTPAPPKKYVVNKTSHEWSAP